MTHPLGWLSNWEISKYHSINTHFLYFQSKNKDDRPSTGRNNIFNGDSIVALGHGVVADRVSSCDFTVNSFNNNTSQDEQRGVLFRWTPDLVWTSPAVSPDLFTLRHCVFCVVAFSLHSFMMHVCLFDSPKNVFLYFCFSLLEKEKNLVASLIWQLFKRMLWRALCFSLLHVRSVIPQLTGRTVKSCFLSPVAAAHR